MDQFLLITPHLPSIPKYNDQSTHPKTSFSGTLQVPLNYSRMTDILFLRLRTYVYTCFASFIFVAKL